MLSKNKIKLIQSLKRKKNRDEAGLFVAEGEKLVTELISVGFQIQTLITTNSKVNRYSGLKVEICTASYDEIKKVSSLTTPQDVIAICRQKTSMLKKVDFGKELIIALDDIQDPGNLGTIIRLASWFGIKHIICSAHTVDCFNPKVIQSTMGAIAHVSLHYTSLPDFLISARESSGRIYGTFLDGNNIYTTPLEKSGIIIMGNEGQGISESVEELVNQKLYIPSFAPDNTQVESLNVSVATSIVCSEFMRRTL